MSNMFKREKFEKKGILRDEKSIIGLVDKSAGSLTMGDILAYNHTSKKWVKYNKTNHNNGTYLLGVIKEDIDVSSEDKKIAVLVRGEVDRRDVKAVANDEELYGLLGKQGIFLL